MSDLGEGGIARYDAHDVVSTLEPLKGYVDQFVIIGGAAMVLYGAKKLTRDIDMLASDKLLQMFKASGHWQVTTKQPPQRAVDAGANNETLQVMRDPSFDGSLRPVIEATDCMGDGHYPISFKGLNQRTDVAMINGLPCILPEKIIASKVSLCNTYPDSARYDRDQEDIARLQEFINVLGNNGLAHTNVYDLEEWAAAHTHGSVYDPVMQRSLFGQVEPF